MTSPICTVKDGSGSYVATTGGVNVTPGNTITIKLSDSSVKTWSIQCVTTDELGDAAATTAALTIDPVLKTATFTAPVAGRVLRFRSLVENGVGPNGATSAYETTFCIYTLTGGGKRVRALDEELEGGTFGWVGAVNELLRNPLSGYGDTYCPINTATATITTSDATVTTLTSYTMSDETLVAFDVIVTAARQTNVTKGGRWKRSFVYRRTSAGAPALVGAVETVGTDQETDAGLNVTVDTSSNDVRVRVTGIAATNFRWSCELRIQKQLP